MITMNLESITEELKRASHDVLEALKESLGVSDSDRAKDEYSNQLKTESISSLLPYLGWHDDVNMFILDTGEIPEGSKKKSKRSLGFCLEFNPQTGASNSMEDILQALYIQTPVGTSISIHNYASPNILPTLKSMARKRYSDATLGIEKESYEKRNRNIFQRLARKRIDFYLQGTSKSLFGDKANFMTRNFRNVISVNMDLNPHSDKDLEQAIIVRDQVRSTLVSAGFDSYEWKPMDLINFLSDFFDHSRIQHIPSRTVKEYEEHTSIRKQIIGREINSCVKADSIDFSNDMGGEDTSVIQMSVTQYPKYFHLSMMSDLIGDQFQIALSYPCPFMITTSAYTQDYDASRQKTNLKVASAVRKSEGWSAKIDPLVFEEKAEWQAAQKALEEGGTLIKMFTTVTLITERKKASKTKSEVMALWRSKGFRLSIDKYQQLISFMASLPMGVTKPFYSDLNKMQKYNTKYSRNAISLSPMIGEWKGTPTPVMTFFGRRGQLMTIDLFDNKAGNFNFCVVGASGAGKSFMTQELLMSYRAIGATVWVIDVGRSYENICRLIDGDFIEFTEGNDICINPFTHVHDLNEEGEMDMLKPLVAQMMSPNKELDSWSMATIEKAIRNVYNQKGNSMTITDVAEFLESYKDSEGNTDQRYADLGHQLFPWTKDGAYGKYFNGEANISFKNKFTVLELEELKGRKDLQAIVLMIMMHRITNEMYLSRDSRKLCMIDEAWAILSGGEGGNVAAFIETGYRRVRKYFGSMGSATQSYEDYFASPAAKAAFQNSDWTFTLRQKSDSIKLLEEKGLLEIKDNPYKKRYFNSLKKIDDMYSEVYIQYPDGEGGARLIVDPESAMLYSSKAEQFARIQQYKDKGLSVADAVERTMNDFNVKVPSPISYKYK